MADAIVSGQNEPAKDVPVNDVPAVDPKDSPKKPKAAPVEVNEMDKYKAPKGFELETHKAFRKDN